MYLRPAGRKDFLHSRDSCAILRIGRGPIFPDRGAETTAIFAPQRRVPNFLDGEIHAVAWGRMGEIQFPKKCLTCDRKKRLLSTLSPRGTT